MADRRVTLEVDHDPARWTLVPLRFPTGGDSSRRHWVKRNARQRRESGFVETQSSGSLEDYFTTVIATVHDRLSGHDQVWALLPDDAPVIMFMLIDFGPIEATTDEVMQTLAGDRPGQERTPVVSTVRAAHLGTLTRVLRHDRDDRGRLVAHLYHYFRDETFRDDGFEMITNSYADDVDTMEWATPAINALLDGIRVVPIGSGGTV